MLDIDSSRIGRNWALVDPFGETVGANFDFTVATSGPPAIVALNADLGAVPQEIVELPNGDCEYEFHYILQKQSPGPAVAGYSNRFRYHYKRVGGADVSPQIRGDLYNDQGWQNWPVHRAGNLLSLDEGDFGKFNLRPMFAELRESMSADDFAAQVPGVWEVVQEQYAVDSFGSLLFLGSRLVATINYHFILFSNIVKQRLVFDPESDEGPVEVSADVILRPLSPSWLPDSPLELYSHVLTSDFQIVVGGGTNLTVNTPDVNGKIAEISLSWDGTDSLGDIVEGSFYFPISIIGTETGLLGNLWQPIDTTVVCKRIPCDCGITENGPLQLSLDLSMQGSPVGPSHSPMLSYHSMAAGSLPSSMGYGWRGAASATLNDQGSKVYYRNESNQSMNWNLSGGNYLPNQSDNYVELEAITGNPAYDFQLTFQDQSQRRFLNGKLVADVDRNGNATSYSYFTSGPNAGRLQSVTNGARRTDYDYGTRTDGQPRFIRAYLDGVATGRVVELVYNANNRLEQILDPAGESRAFEYDSQGQLAAIYDARGFLAQQYVYDEVGRVFLEQVYDQLWRFYLYDQALPGTNSGVVVLEYDLELNTDYLSRGPLEVFQQEEPDRMSARYFDLRGNTIRSDEYLELPNPAADPPDPGVYNTTLMAYADPNNPWLMTSITRPNGSTTTMTYNTQGLVKTVHESFNDTLTRYDYTEDVDTLPIPALRRNLLRRIERPALIVGGVPQAPTVVEFDYDSFGNLNKMVDPRGKITTMNLLGNGQIDYITDRRGSITRFAYDSLTKNLLEVIEPDESNNPGRKVRLGYDLGDNVNSVKDDLNNEITTQYDDIDRVLRVTDARGNYVDMTYELGLLTEIDSPDNEGSATNRRRVRMPRTTHYDFAGRLLQVDAEKSTNTFETRVEYLYTGFSQIRSLLRLKDAVTKSTDYSYDRLGRLLNINDFKGDDTDLEHAPFCSNSTVKTPRGIHRKSVFDGLCRMTQVETQEERHLFDYDELDRLIRATVGERYAHTPPGQSRQGGRYAKTVLKFNTDYVYDENDRVTHIHYPNGDTVAYTYDDEGNVLSVTDVHGKTTSYTYYRDGRLKTVSYAGQTFSYSYDAAGRLSQIDYPTSTNVVVSFTKTDTTTGWDPNGQLLSVRYLKSGTEFQRFVYSYDNSGNRKTMDEVRTLSGTPVTVNWAYTYDGFNRLAQVYKNSNLVSVYTYDESDNRTQVDWPQSGEVWKMTFDIADRIEKREYKVGAGAFSDFETYTHDDDGNMTSRTLVASSTTVSYDWNSHNRLRQVRENGAHKESTSFDHGGIRRLKADSGGNTKYFSSAGMSLADTRPSGEVSFLQGHQLLGLEESGNLYYFVTDGLSSVRLVLDSSGNIQGELRYNEWGVPEAAVSPLSAPAAGLSGHSYTGGLGVRNDGASLGLYYARQRYYDADLGRWLTPDPIGFSGGLNLYAYVDNSPTSGADPEGLQGPFAPWILRAYSTIVETCGTRQVTREVFRGSLIDLLPAGLLPALGIGTATGFGIAYGMSGGLPRVPGSQTLQMLMGPQPMLAAPNRVFNVYSGSRHWRDAGISPSDALRIQNAAKRTGVTIRVVGSRARGKACPDSDWDYVIGGNSRTRHSAAGSLPRGSSGGAQTTRGWTGQDIYTEAQFLPDRPYLEFLP